MPLGCTADAARGLDRHGRLGPRADAGAAAAGGAGRVRAADPAAQRRRGDRLVLGVLLHHRRGDRLGRSTSRCRPACRPSSAANVAKLSPGFAEHLLADRPRLRRRRARVAWVWLVRWRTGRNRHPLWKSMVLPAGGVTLCLAAGDDRAAAAVRQRAQLPLDGAAGRPADAASRLHLDAGHVAGAGRRARVPGRLAGRRRHAAGQVALRDPDPAAPAASRRTPRGCSWPGNAACAARTTSSTSTSAPAGALTPGASDRRRRRRRRRLRRRPRPPAPPARRAPAPPGRSGGRSSPCRARSSTSSSPP